MVAEKLICKESKGFNIKDNVIIGDKLESWETRCIAQTMLETFSETPNFVFQINVDTGEQMTFAEIKDCSIRCALWLQKQGIGKDDIVSISTPNQNDDLIPYMATLFVGAIFNPWYHDLTDLTAHRFFKTYQPKIMFACEASIDQLSRIAKSEGITCQFVVYGKHPEYPSLRQLLAEQSTAEVASFKYSQPADPSTQCAIILFSSGTTGTPKGTMLSYESLANITFPLDVGTLETQRYLWYSSLSWISGAYLLLACMRDHVIRIMHKEFDADATSKVIENYKVTKIFLTPSMLIQCCKEKVFTRYDYSSLKELFTGGSKLSRTILEETQRILPQCFVKNGYGMTEANGGIAVQTRERKKIDAVGYVSFGIKLKIIDLKTGRKLGPNQEGEICVLKRAMFLGYYKNPEETAKTLDKDGWVHTGDLGYYDQDGELMVTGRIKQLIIMQNYHVSPSEIEDILLRHPGVKDCAVVPVPHEIDIERPFAFVVKVPNTKVTEVELKELPTSHNEYYRLTGGVVFVDDLNYTSTGKKNLQLLKEKAKKYISS